MAATKMVVPILQEHIDTATETLRPGRYAKEDHLRACECPLALALFTKEKCKWIVSTKTANPMGKNEEMWELDQDAYDFVLAFDCNEDVQPCQVTLVRRAPVKKGAVRGSRKPRGTNSSTSGPKGTGNTDTRPSKTNRKGKKGKTTE